MLAHLYSGKQPGSPFRKFLPMLPGTRKGKGEISFPRENKQTILAVCWGQSVQENHNRECAIVILWSKQDQDAEHSVETGSSSLFVLHPDLWPTSWFPFVSLTVNLQRNLQTTGNRVLAGSGRRNGGGTTGQEPWWISGLGKFLRRFWKLGWRWGFPFSLVPELG